MNELTALGAVTATGSPVQVRIFGDTVDVSIGLKASGLTFTIGDKVGLVRYGGQWVVDCIVVAT